MKKLIYIVGIAALFFLFLYNPLWHSKASIKESFLKQVPLGSSMEEVIALLERKNYEIKYIDYDMGFIDYDFYPEKLFG